MEANESKEDKISKLKETLAAHKVSAGCLELIVKKAEEEFKKAEDKLSRVNGDWNCIHSKIKDVEMEIYLLDLPELDLKMLKEAATNTSLMIPKHLTRFIKTNRTDPSHQALIRLLNAGLIYYAVSLNTESESSYRTNDYGLKILNEYT